jgi:hypothetical protein
MVSMSRVLSFEDQFVAQQPRCTLAGFFRCHSAGDVLLGAHLDGEPEFVVELGFQPVLSQ